MYEPLNIKRIIDINKNVLILTSCVENSILLMKEVNEMFIEKLKENFKLNEPIFTKEILELFSNYSRAYVFRLIENAVENKEIIKFDLGVYYIPYLTEIGLSTITVDDVMVKKYMRTDSDFYGIYSGLTLLNYFHVITQVPHTKEIVTNNETTRCRKVKYHGRDFILKKSRCKITKENFYTYVVLQLFTEAGIEEEMDEKLKQHILEYMKNTNVHKNDLIELSKYFPDRTLRNLMNSGVLNETT